MDLVTLGEHYKILNFQKNVCKNNYAPNDNLFFLFYRHGWASTLGNLRPSHVKVICPTAYVSKISTFDNKKK